MKILITGTAKGIGRAIASRFLAEGHDVLGMDLSEKTISHQKYRHVICDVRDAAHYPDYQPEILINNAGVQDSGCDIDVNLKGLITLTEHYAFQACDHLRACDWMGTVPAPAIRAVINIGSSSAHTGSEFAEYAASKGGLLAYTKNLALRLAPQATCNSIDPGGVLTELNQCVIEDEHLWEQIMALTPMKRWASPEEIAEWVYFLAVKNRFMTGQNLLIDGGEAGYNKFIWK